MFKFNSDLKMYLIVISVCVPLLQVVRSSPTAPESQPSRPRTPSMNRRHCQGWVSASLPPSSSHSLSVLSMVVSHAICTRLHTSRHSTCIVPEMKNTLESNSINSSAFWRPGFNFSMCLFSRGYSRHWSDPLCLVLLKQQHRMTSK